MAIVVEKLIPYCISCTIGIYIVYDFMNSLFKNRCSKRISRVIQIILATVWITTNMIGSPLLNFTVFAASTLSVGFFQYNVKQLKNIFRVIILIISYAVCDTSVSITMALILKGSVPLFRKDILTFYINIVLVQLIMIIINKFLIFIFKSTNTQGSLQSKKLRTACFTIFPALNIIFIYLIIVLASHSVTQNTTYMILILLTISAPILNLIQIYLFKYISKSNDLECELAVMQDQIKMQYDYYHNLEEKYNEMQRIMHDIKHHICIIQDLYENDNLKSGVNYTQQVFNIINENELKFRCRNNILNIIINEKIQLSRKHNIEFLYSIEDIDLKFLTDIDITALFANLIDNAFEACLKVKYTIPKINLKIYQWNDMIVINLTNTTENPPVQENGVFVSSKKGHRAIGLENIHRIVEKYNGDINIEVEQNQFSVSILFPLIASKQ